MKLFFISTHTRKQFANIRACVTKVNYMFLRVGECLACQEHTCRAARRVELLLLTPLWSQLLHLATAMTMAEC